MDRLLYRRRLLEQSAEEPWVDDGKIHGLLTVPSDGTYRIFYSSGVDNAGRFTAVTIDGVSSGTTTRDVTLTAGEHEIVYTPKDNRLGLIFKETNSYWTDIYIPDTITYISDAAFQGMNFSCVLHIDKAKITYIGTNAFRQCRVNFGDINFPYLSSTGNYPFYDYYRNAPVTNLGSLTTIGDYCFNNAGITSFDIPATVTSIGQRAFFINSYSITYTFRSTTPPTYGTTAIWRTPVAIYVPADSVAAYKAASGWSSWANQIQAIP